MKNIVSLNSPKKSKVMEDLEWLTEFLLANGRVEMAKELNDDFAAFQQTLITERKIEAA